MSMRPIVSMVLALAIVVFASASPSWAATVSLTFDDGLNGTNDFAYPILKKYGAPGVTGIITSRIEPAHEEFMNWAEIDKLAAAGWEIASHSVNHPRPVEVPAFYSQEPIKDWILASSKPSVYHAHYQYVLLNGLYENGRKLKEVASVRKLKSTPGSYFYDRVIECLQVRPFDAPDDPAKLDIRAFSYEREMEQSKKELSDHGIEVKTFIPPYNYWTAEAKEASKSFYQSAMTGEDQDNRPATFDRYAIKRYMVHTKDSVSALMRIVKENAAEDKNSWVIFCFHNIGDTAGWEPWSSDNLERFVAWLRAEGIDIVTVSDGADRMAKLAQGK